MFHFRSRAIACTWFLAAGYAFAGTPITAVGPAMYWPLEAEKSTPALRAPDAAPAARIVLPAVSDAELNQFKAKNAVPANAGAPSASAKSSRLAVAFGRDVPSGSRTVLLNQLKWQTLSDGTRVARIEVTSPGAAATRLALQLPGADPDLTVAFAGTGAHAQVFGPYPANRIASDTVDFGQYWTPVLLGQTAIIEFAAPKSAKLAGAVLTLALISHQVVAPGELNHLSAKTLSDIGRALPCEIDIKCVTPQSTAFVNQTKAVASLLFAEDDGSQFLCTGQLLNDSVTDFVPYFFTANHCIDGPTPARTLNTFWFFWATACDGMDTLNPGYVQQTAGSALLARSPDWDWALVRLNVAPPGGAFFSAWRAETVPNGTNVAVLHHPAGDLQKFSQGNAAGYFSDIGYAGTTPATFLRMTYTDGQTEGGSSGSGILTISSDGTFYEVRGGLYNGANPSCPRPNGYTDNYSRLDNMLPLVRDYLTPGSSTSTDPVVVVEFYNANLNHYFMSAAPAEINDLDTGVHPGWVRTGIRFLAYNYAAAGTNPVCRFYRTPAFGDSHFYSASPAECAATHAQHPIDWTYESPNVFYIFLPDPNTGACPVNTRPLWRFFNQITTNHRYTPEVKIRDDLRADPAQWIPEGYGTDAVIMCSPLGS